MSHARSPRELDTPTLPKSLDSRALDSVSLESRDLGQDFTHRLESVTLPLSAPTKQPASHPDSQPRTLSKQEIEALLHNRTKQWDFPTLSSLPHPYTLKSCKEACEFLAEKIRQSQNLATQQAPSPKPCKILVVGDYDVDGVIASVVMMKFFAQIGYGHVEYVIPSRFDDGYGVSSAIVKQHPSDVVITVDNGITAYEAAEYCAQQGIPLIITDHHIPKDTLPNAPFIINPQRRDCSFAQREICGAMVAWYFCAGLKIALGVETSLTPLLELVMLATIADMMPLTQINKCVVLYGLRRFSSSEIPALRKLKTRLKTRYITATDISFSLTPLINAAGRMGEGRIASEFLLLDDSSLESNMHARSNLLDSGSLDSGARESSEFDSHSAPQSTQESTRLERALDSGLQALLALNQTRKDTAKAVLDSAHSCAIVYDHAVIARGDDWHEGVLGIVAAQLASAYERPAFVLSITQPKHDNKAREKDGHDDKDCDEKAADDTSTGAILKGSARSWNDIDVMQILLGAGEILGEFGGHSKAAGLSVEIARFHEFCAYLSQLHDLPKCKPSSSGMASDSGCGREAEVGTLQGEPLSGEALDDMAVLPIDSRDIDEELFALLDRFEPYGQGNPKPTFISSLRIKRIQSIKAHRKLSFFGTPIQGMWFFASEKLAQNGAGQSSTGQGSGGELVQGEMAEITFSMQMDSFSHRPMMIVQSLRRLAPTGSRSTNPC